jgi:hypothetical protein
LPVQVDSHGLLLHRLLSANRWMQLTCLQPCRKTLVPSQRFLVMSAKDDGRTQSTTACPISAVKATNNTFALWTRTRTPSKPQPLSLPAPALPLSAVPGAQEASTMSDKRDFQKTTLTDVPTCHPEDHQSLLLPSMTSGCLQQEELL